MTDDHNPVEYSWDFHTGAEDPTIRYPFEPIGGLDGRPDSQSSRSQSFPEIFVESLMAVFPHANLECFSHITKFFTAHQDPNAQEGDSSAVF
jgi:hypothetical protein